MTLAPGGASAPAAVHQLDYPQLQDFLSWIYGPERVGRVWMTGFRDIEEAPSWHGGPGLARLEGQAPDPFTSDLYFCIGMLRPGARGRMAREVEAQPLLIVDDIGTKIDTAKWEALFASGMPRPSFRIQTSPGNETWGWVLAGDDAAPERRDELALIRGWLVEKGLTDNVMDESRYIRLPSGWNSKPKYRPEGAGIEASPRVGLVKPEPFLFGRGRVDIGDIGTALLATPDWRSAPMPVGAMTGNQLNAAIGAGALRRTADLKNPDPIIKLADVIGLNPVQVRQGVVEARCPNIAAHTTRAETGFAFLGNGLAQCQHASCQALRSGDFRAMMEQQYDLMMEGRVQLGLPLEGLPLSASAFLARADFEGHGVGFGGNGGPSEEDPVDNVGAVAERVQMAAEAREESEEEAKAGLAKRFVWVNSLLAFFDTEGRTLVARDQFDTHKAVRPWFEVGLTGAKRAANVLLNRADAQDAEGLTFMPGVAQAVVVAELENGRRGECVNTWVAPDVGRRPGDPVAWLELVERIIPDQSYRDWFLDWLAHMIQRPGVRSPVIPLIVGAQGVGKDMMLSPFVEVMGRHNCAVVDMQRLGSQFNEWQRSALVILPELKLSADGRLYNSLKDWTGAGNTRLTINEKYLRPYTIKPVANFVAFTNGLDALKGMEADDRRMGVYISPAVKQPGDYYRHKAAALADRAEVERVHEFLATRNLGGFNAHAPAPDVNGAKALMLSDTLGRAARWVYDECQPGGMFSGRVYLTLKEVEDAARLSGNRSVAQEVGPRAVRDGLLAAGCEPLGQTRAGQDRKSLWLGPAPGTAERDRIKALPPSARGKEAVAELTTVQELAAYDLLPESAKTPRAADDAQARILAAATA